MNTKRSILCATILSCALVLTTACAAHADILQLKQHYQERTQWCWAAVSESLLEAYGTPYGQSEIAEYGTDGENNWNWLSGTTSNPTRRGMDLILEHFGALETHFVTDHLSSEDVAAAFAEKKPFVIRWEWSSGSGHFVVAHGIENDSIYLMDPWNGPTINTYKWVDKGGDHVWTHTLLMTKALGSHVPAGPLWQNPVDKFDVSNDGAVTAIDSVKVARYLKKHGEHPRSQIGVAAIPTDYVDVNGDDLITRADFMEALSGLRAVADRDPASTSGGQNKRISKLRVSLSSGRKARSASARLYVFGTTKLLWSGRIVSGARSKDFTFRNVPADIVVVQGSCVQTVPAHAGQHVRVRCEP